MDDLKNLQSVGLTLPEPAYLLGIFLFSVIGFAAYRYDRKAANMAVKWLGIGLMLYPYAVADTWLQWAVGAGLCAGLSLSIIVVAFSLANCWKCASSRLRGS